MLLGAVPFQSDVKRLKELGVSGVVTLNEPYETLVPTSLYEVSFLAFAICFDLSVMLHLKEKKEGQVHLHSSFTFMPLPLISSVPLWNWDCLSVL